MLQGGCPDGTGMGGPGYHIRGEFTQNGFKNDLRHTEGVLSMARTMIPNSAGSQFFIMHKAAPHLDGQYAAFGKVIEGMDVVNEIAECDTDYSDKPLQPVLTQAESETDGGRLDMTIDELELSVRSYNCLKRAGINTVGELCNKTFRRSGIST